MKFLDEGSFVSKSIAIKYYICLPHEFQLVALKTNSDSSNSHLVFPSSFIIHHSAELSRINGNGGYEVAFAVCMKDPVLKLYFVFN